MMGPAWSRGEIEPPAGEKDMGTWVSAAYTAEQQARLGVDESGAPLNTAGPADPGGFREQFTVVGEGPELKARGAAAKAAKACATPAAACCRGCPRSSSELS